MQQIRLDDLAILELPCFLLQLPLSTQTEEHRSARDGVNNLLSALNGGNRV